MVVHGLGVDIIEIARLQRSAERGGDRFLAKVFTAGELAYCAAKHNRFQHLAARFAAKEAVSKALGTGWAGDFRWKDVEVGNDPAGRPHVTLHGPLRERLAAATVHLSISHSETHVVAVALVEGPAP